MFVNLINTSQKDKFLFVLWHEYIVMYVYIRSKIELGQGVSSVILNTGTWFPLEIAKEKQ